MAWAALVVAIVSLAVTIFFAIRTERWRRAAFKQEARDRKEALQLQRHTLEYDDEGWRRWGRRPPPPED